MAGQANTTLIVPSARSSLDLNLLSSAKSKDRRLLQGKMMAQKSDSTILTKVSVPT